MRSRSVWSQRWVAVPPPNVTCPQTLVALKVREIYERITKKEISAVAA